MAFNTADEEARTSKPPTGAAPFVHDIAVFIARRTAGVVSRPAEAFNAPFPSSICPIAPAGLFTNHGITVNSLQADEADKCVGQPAAFEDVR